MTTKAIVTVPGRNLARRLGIDTHLGACSLIARHARTYYNLQMMRCEADPAMDDPGIPIKIARKMQAKRENWIEKRDEELSTRLTELVNELGYTVILTKDPRGYCVYIDTKDEILNRRWDWGGRGVPAWGNTVI